MLVQIKLKSLYSYDDIIKTNFNNIKNILSKNKIEVENIEYNVFLSPLNYDVMANIYLVNDYESEYIINLLNYSFSLISAFYNFEVSFIKHDDNPEKIIKNNNNSKLSKIRKIIVLKDKKG